MKEPNLKNTTIMVNHVGKAACAVCNVTRRCTYADREMQSLGTFICGDCVFGLVVADIVLNSPQTGLTRPAA